MTALACLRVLVSSPPEGVTAQTLAALVARVGEARLQKSWAWPRRYGLVAPFSFMLADPSADKLDVSELPQLAVDLQRTLFGSAAAGKVALILFEGDQSAVTRLAAASVDDLESVLGGLTDAPFDGRILRITSAGMQEVDASRALVHVAPATAAAEKIADSDLSPLPFVPTSHANVGFWGIYFLGRERFIGSAVNWPPLTGLDLHSLSDSRACDGDLENLDQVAAIGRTVADGYVFVAVNFSTLVRPTAREAFLTRLSQMQGLDSIKLAANVYGVPRSLSYGATLDIKAKLKPHFSLLNLHVEDPDFEIASLLIGLVDSVTLVLSGRSEVESLAILTRFEAHAPGYRAKKVWQGVAGVRTPREVDLCRRLNIPFLSGPAVMALTHRPAGQVIWPACDLPYNGWSNDAEITSACAQPRDAPTPSSSEVVESRERQTMR